MKIIHALLLAFGTFLAGSAHAVVLAGWTFETNMPADLAGSAVGPAVAAETGSGSFHGVHVSTASNWFDQQGNGSAISYTSTGWTTGDYYEFSTSSVGHEDITVSLDSIGASTAAPRDFQLSYSTDGTNFTNFGAVYSIVRNNPADIIWDPEAPVSGTTYSFDLSGVSALDDAATIFFRVSQVGTTSVSGGTVGSAGGVRMDNVLINGTAIVPEPSAVFLGALGVLGLFSRRRRIWG